jgi:hypothetical protein
MAGCISRVCTSADMHPYECSGPGKCIHCDRKRTAKHHPVRCCLCHETLQRHPKDWRNCPVCVQAGHNLKEPG